jgi:anti-sigma factor RsiW
MLTCRWAAHRIQRYLDADPVARLAPVEVARLEAHMAECARCTRRAQEYRALARSLHDWSASRAPEPRLVARVQQAVLRISSEGPR